MQICFNCEFWNVILCLTPDGKTEAFDFNNTSALSKHFRLDLEKKFVETQKFPEEVGILTKW